MTDSFTNEYGMKFVKVQSGKYIMGSPSDEIGRDPDEAEHVVDIDGDYYIQDTPVTNAQYREYERNHHSGYLFGNSLNEDEQPVVSVTWNDAIGFCKWLSSQDKIFTYTLPTEAQWEYAARAGTSGRYWWGSDPCEIANYANVYGKNSSIYFPWFDHFDIEDRFVVTSPVRSFKPNPWGLFDVLGNVWEMCSNWHYKYPKNTEYILKNPTGPDEGIIKAVRGGDYLSIYFFARIANRTWTTVTERVDSQGFRAMAVPKRQETDIQQNTKCASTFQVGTPTWSGEVKDYFSQIDIDHMKAITAQWTYPMDLGDYSSVKRDAMRIYSSVRGKMPRMPVDPKDHWSEEQQKRFFVWMMSNCPED